VCGPLPVLISGQMQSVSFRATCQRTASQYGVTGWVRHPGDGSVEALLEGPAQEAQHLPDRTRRGPRPAVATPLTPQPNSQKDRARS